MLTMLEQYIRLVAVIHQFDEGHLIFDRYDIPDSPKEATREKGHQVKKWYFT